MKRLHLLRFFRPQTLLSSPSIFQHQAFLPCLYTLLCIAALICLQLFFFTQSIPDFNWFYNSDSLYLPALYRDLAENAQSFKSWFLTPSPYFFPDMLIYFPLDSLTNHFHVSVGLYFFVQLALIYLFTIRIYQSFFTTGKAIIFSSISFIYFCSLTALIEKPFAYTLISAFHVGAFISLLMLTDLTLRVLNSQNPDKKLYILIAVVAALSILSDKLILIHGILPIIATLTFLKIIPVFKAQFSMNKYMLLIAAVVLGSVIGRLSYLGFVPNQTDFSGSLELNPTLLAKNLQGIKESFSGIQQIGHGAWPMFFVFFGLCTFCFFTYFHARGLARFFKKGEATHEQDHTITLKIFFFSALTLATLSATFLLFSVAKNTSGWGLNSRYFIPLFYYPILFSPLMLIILFPRLTKAFGSIAFLIIPLFAFGHMFHHRTIDMNKFSLEFYPKTFECIDRIIEKENLTHGAAQYWNARYTDMISRHKVQVVSLRQELTPYIWIINKDRFRDSYDFIIIDSTTAWYEVLDEQKIYTLNGPPKKVEQCEHLKFIIYPKGQLKLPTIKESEIKEYARTKAKS